MHPVNKMLHQNFTPALYDNTNEDAFPDRRCNCSDWDLTVYIKLLKIVGLLF